jgi:hypothetical protein
MAVGDGRRDHMRTRLRGSTDDTTRGMDGPR